MSEHSLREELDRLQKENQLLTGKIVGGMTQPVSVKSTIIEHAEDSKTREKIAPTVRQDMGFDPNQRFAGRQP